MAKIETKIYDARISDLAETEHNPRQISKKDFAKLKKSLKDFPEMLNIREVVIDENNVILGGHQRVKAALANGDETIPVKQVFGLTDEQKRQFVIKDNIANGDWDWDEIANAWSDMPFDDWGLDVDWAEPKEIVEDAAPEVNESEPAKSELGKVYQLGEHRLMCGDSTSSKDVAKLMNGQKADMVFTDPPYGYNYQSNMRTKTEKFEILKNDDKILDFFPLLKDFNNGFVFVCTTWKTLDKWLPLFKHYYDLTNMIIWDKGGGGIGDLKHTFLTDYEIILCSNNNREITGKRIGSVWTIHKDSPNDYMHATQKPVQVSSNAIANTTIQNDLILDLFGGSGSTLIACEQLGRKCYMMELDPKYCDVIRKRYWEFVNGSEDGWEESTPEVERS